MCISWMYKSQANLDSIIYNKNWKKVFYQLLISNDQNVTFRKCSSLIKIEIPSSVTSFGRGVSKGDLSLKEISISSSAASIKELTYSGCTKLTSVTIPSSVTSIGERAFYRCSQLVEIIIPSSTI